MVVGEEVTRRAQREAEVVGLALLADAVVGPKLVVDPLTEARRKTVQVPPPGLEGA